MLGSLLLAPVLWAQPATANAIKAVVGGQIIITQWDVNREARLTRLDPALAQKKLEQDALLVMNIKSQKNYVEPAGLGELLLRNEIKNRYDNSRNQMIADLRVQGKTVQQRESELVDDWILRQAERTVRQAVQVSPAAIKQYYAGHPDLNNKGLTVDLYAIRIPRIEDGMTIAKAQELKSGIQSLDDFKKLAAERSVPRGGHRGLVHKDDQREFSDEIAAEVFLMEEKETALAFDDQAYYLLHVAQQWDKYEIPIDQVHKLIETRLGQEIFEHQMERKLNRLRREIHVYYPRGTLMIQN